MIISAVVLVWCVVSVAVATFQTRQAADRLRLVSVTTNTLAVLTIARAMAPWPGASAWGWTLSALGFSLTLALVAYRWPELPLHPEETSDKKRRWAMLVALSPLWLVALVGWTFL